MEEHHSVKNELLRNKDDQGWRRLTRITNDKLEKVKLNFSRFANCNEVPLTGVDKLLLLHCTVFSLKSKSTVPHSRSFSRFWRHMYFEF